MNELRRASWCWVIHRRLLFLSVVFFHWSSSSVAAAAEKGTREPPVDESTANNEQSTGATVFAAKANFPLLYSRGGIASKNASDATAAAASTGARFLRQGDGREYVRVVVGFDGSSFSYNGKRYGSDFRRTNAAVMTIPSDKLDALSKTPGVEWIEEDATTYAQQRIVTPSPPPPPSSSSERSSSSLLTSETVPWGITAIQGDDDSVPPAHPKISTCFAVCVVDSGVQLSHPDLPFGGEGYDSSSAASRRNVRGTTISSSGYLSSSSSPSSSWDSPLNGHGTHVAGTIMAQGGNGIGVRGVVSSPSKICLYVASVFGDGEDQTSNSNIDMAVEWCVDRGAKVVNLSLGTPMGSYNSELIVNRIAREEDVLLVAASGNDGKPTLFYPASYDGVISVGSVDQDLFRSEFSNYNDQVDLVAPGDEILSLSTHASVTLTDESGEDIFAILMMESVFPDGSVTGAPHYCGLGSEPCYGASGKICVIVRGIIPFYEKARNCELGGGKAAVIYNNLQGSFFGTLTLEHTVGIPVVSIAQSEGMKVRSARTLTMNLEEGAYSWMSGTSMAGTSSGGALFLFPEGTVYVLHVIFLILVVW